MWLGGISAAEGAVEQQPSDSLLVLGAGILIAAMVPLGSVIVELIRSRNAKTTASPPAPVPTASSSTDSHKDIRELFERTAKHNERFRQGDQANHAQDLLIRGITETQDEHGDHLRDHHRRLSRIERHLGFDDA